MDRHQHAENELSRRRFAQGLASGSLVVGFDVLTGTWVTAASADARSDFASVPPLAGTLHVDAETRRTYARDYGQIVHAPPAAVLRPGSIEDIVEIVHFARRAGLRIAARGHAHQPFGQAQVKGGIVVDMQTLNQVHAVSDDQIAVDAGADWRTVLNASMARQRTPPVLPNYLGLTVGGTLAIGGVGPASLHHGAQVDHVRELQVVTGKGERLTCSATERPDLFEAVLAGQGQCAIITRAVLSLIAAQPWVREYMLPYAGLSALLRDLHAVALDRRFDGAVGLIVASPEGYKFALQAMRQFTPGSPPDAAPLYAGLHNIGGAESVRDAPYVEYMDAHPEFDPQASHPDLGLMLPGPEAEAFLADTLPRLTEAELGPATAMRVFLWERALFTRPLLRLPDSETCVYAAILRAQTTDPALLSRMLSGNRRLFERDRELGGTLYPFCALQLTRSDWQRYYQAAWTPLLDAKRRYDPSNVFASGPELVDRRKRRHG
jgi:cytokinin dehydrogenase